MVPRTRPSALERHSESPRPPRLGRTRSPRPSVDAKGSPVSPARPSALERRTHEQLDARLTAQLTVQQEQEQEQELGR